MLRFNLLVLAASVFLVAMHTPAVAQDNLCPNAGFEEGGGADGPKSWEGTKEHVKWDDEVAHSGKRSAKITSEGGPTVGWTSDLIPLPKPG